MGRSKVEACTLPMKRKLSSNTRCLAATCAEGSRCCIAQPPHTPKYAHLALTLSEDSRNNAVMCAASHLDFLRKDLNLTISPGNAASTKITLPGVPSSLSRWPTPRPSISRDSMVIVSWSD